MSGHSKWSQIKHKKAATDAKRGVLFGKLARAITIAAHENPDPATNLRLQGEIQRARAANMPSDSIDRAIRRVTDKDATALQEVQTEFIGPGNVAIIATAITDNSNRTVTELRRMATQHGAHAADAGSVRWMFASRGLARVAIDSRDKDKLQLLAIDAGADDVISADGSLLVLCPPEHLSAVEQALGDAVRASSLALVPTTVVAVPEDVEEQLWSFVSALEQHEDVQKVFTNATTYGDTSWD